MVDDDEEYDLVSTVHLTIASSLNTCPAHLFYTPNRFMSVYSDSKCGQCY